MSQAVNSFPKIHYEDKHTVRVVAESRTALLEWWRSKKSTAPFNQLVAERTSEQPHTCFLRLDLGSVNKGIEIQSIFKNFFTNFDDLPPTNLFQFILKNPDKSYSIEGRSYKILSLISSQGCYGDVFLACDQETKAQVVIKILRTPGDMEHTVLKKIQKQGGHPNIVQYIGSATLMNKIWIVMEYLEGDMCYEYTKKSKWTTALTEQYESALQFLEKAGITTERENEQENMMIVLKDKMPVLKLIDFSTLARS